MAHQHVIPVLDLESRVFFYINLYCNIYGNKLKHKTKICSIAIKAKAEAFEPQIKAD